MSAGMPAVCKADRNRGICECEWKHVQTGCRICEDGMYGSETNADDDSSLHRWRCRSGQNRTADPEGAAVGSNETIESDDCVAAGLNRRCPGIGCVWQSDCGVPEPAKGLKDPAFTPFCQLCLIQLKTDLLPTEQSGHSKSSGTSSHLVPGAMPPSGYPFLFIIFPATDITYVLHKNSSLKIKIIIVIDIIKLYTGKVKSVRSDCKADIRNPLLATCS